MCVHLCLLHPSLPSQIYSVTINHIEYLFSHPKHQLLSLQYVMHIIQSAERHNIVLITQDNLYMLDNTSSYADNVAR